MSECRAWMIIDATVLDDYNDMQQQKSDDLERAAHVLDDDLEL